MKLSTIRFAILAILIELGLAAVVTVQSTERHVIDTIAILMTTSAVYLISVQQVMKHPQCGRVVLAAAIGYRVTMAGLYPTFTDDVLRYRWESRVQAAGGNPYEARPKDPEWAGLRDETYARIPGHDFRAVYGPFTEMVYAASYRAIAWFGLGARWEVFWLKLPAMVFEAGVVAGLWRLLKAGGWPAERIVIYAWSPLVVFEYWGNGHNDPLMLCPLVWSLWAARTERWRLAFGLLAVATAAKVWPAALVPVFLGWRPRWKAALVYPAVLVSLGLPYGVGLLGNAAFLSGFLGGWRNNDSLYGALLWAAGGDQYGAKYGAFAIVFAVVAVAVWRRWDPWKAALVTPAAMLLVSANVHPWYVGWLVPGLVLSPWLGLLAWTCLAPLSYQVLAGWELLGEWNGSTGLRWLTYGVVFPLLGWEAGKKVWKAMMGSGRNRHVVK